MSAIETFRNFLSWGEQPLKPGDPPRRFNWPPAVWAYCFGSTTYCPPKGEM